MNRAAFTMTTRIDAVDPMVLSLKAAVSGLLTEEKGFAFELCVSEALTNLVKHGSAANEDGTVGLTLQVSEASVTLEIYDAEGAAPFDLRDHAPDLSDIEVHAESGRGLALIMQCADQVDYGASDGANRLSLVFLRG